MLQKHDSNTVLEIVGAMGVVAAFFIAGMLFLIHQDFKKDLQSNVPVSTSSDKKIAIGDLSPELVKELNGSFGNIVQNLDQFAFLLGKSLEKNYTKDEISGFLKDYEAQKAEQQKAAQQQSQQNPISENGVPQPSGVSPSGNTPPRQ